MSKTVLHFGPQHPSGGGLLHMLVTFDGDIVEKVDIDPGFLHRAFEKRAEDRQFFQFIPIANKIDYVGTIAWEGLWVAAVEKALEWEPPKERNTSASSLWKCKELSAIFCFSALLARIWGNLPFFYGRFASANHL